MPSKEICRFVINDKSKKLRVKEKDFILDSVSAKEITKYKKSIIEQAIKYL